MSRRDTIIVAVLVNAGLLLVLFATAVRSKDPVVKPVQQMVSAPAAKPTVVPEKPLAQLPAFDFENEEILFEDTPVMADHSTVALEVQEENEYVSITVKKGDVLEKLAKSNGTTVSAIVQANQLKNTQLHIGQVLHIPLSEATKSIEAKPEYYIVKDGDNPWLIASKSHIRLQELLRLNNLDEKKAKRLRPGDRLRIR